MKDTLIREFAYKCSCGYVAKVFIDFGIPQEYYKCRKCGSKVIRKEA